MKKALLLGAALLLIASVSFAQQLPPLGYIGLFADDMHESWCTSIIGAAFNMWIWALPGENGMKCAEFAIQYPTAGIFAGTVTVNPGKSATLGDLPGGFSICYTECNWDWQWIAYQSIFVMVGDPLVFEIIPSPIVYPLPVYQFANCNEGYPKEPCIKFTNLYVNGECGPIATEESSWGAIKDLFK